MGAGRRLCARDSCNTQAGTKLLLLHLSPSALPGLHLCAQANGTQLVSSDHHTPA